MLFDFLNNLYSGSHLPKDLSLSEKHNVLFAVFSKLLKKYPLNDHTEVKIMETVEYFSNIEEFEKCIDLVDLVKQNKTKFKANE